MRTISIQEQAVVVGGIDTVTVPAKKKDDGGASAALQMSISNSGANSAGSTGGGGGGNTAAPKTVCIDTVEQVCQTPQLTNVTFGITEVSVTQTPGGCKVTKKSVCYPVNSSK